VSNLACVSINTVTVGIWAKYYLGNSVLN